MKVLLTGASGFVGRYVLNAMPCVPLSEGDTQIDLRNLDDLRISVSKIRPDAVIHLAAQSFIPQSFKNPEETFEINFLGTYNLLHTLKEIGFTGKFIFVGSGDMYGLVSTNQLPIMEHYPLKPRSPYAVSKVAAEALCYQWSQTEGFDIVMVRPFSHIGPGQSELFVVSDFAKQIVEIKLGLREPVLRVGDIDVTRDFTDVRDVAAAYRLLLKYGRSGEIYNVSSCIERSIRSLLQMMLDINGVKAKIEQDRERLRPSEHRRLFGSYDKLHKDTGWKPGITIENTLQDILDDWRRKLDE